MNSKTVLKISVPSFDEYDYESLLKEISKHIHGLGEGPIPHDANNPHFLYKGHFDHKCCCTIADCLDGMIDSFRSLLDDDTFSGKLEGTKTIRIGPNPKMSIYLTVSTPTFRNGWSEGKVIIITIEKVTDVFSK